MPPDIYLKRILKGAGFVGIGLIISKLLSYLFRIIIARGLGAEIYGAFNLGLAFEGLITVLAVLGLNEGIIRYVAYYSGKEDKEKSKGVFISAILISGILSIILAVFLFNFADYIAIKYFSDPLLTIVIKILAVIIPFGAVGKLFLAALRADQKIEYVVYTQNIISAIFKLGLGYLAIYFGLGLVGVLGAYAFATVILLIFAFYFVKKKTNLLDRTIKPYFNIKKLLLYSWPLLLTTLLYYLLTWTDSLFVGYFKNSYAVGIYNSAVPLSGLVLILPMAMIPLFLPVVSYLIPKNDKKEINYLFSTVTRWILTINLPLTLLLIIFSKQMINFFFGQEYISATNSLIFLAAGQFIYSLFLTSAELLKSIKKTKFILVVNIIAVVLNIILNIILIPILGILGAAIATTSSYAIRGLIIYLGTYSFFKLNLFKKEYLKPILACLICIIPLYYLVSILNVRFYMVLILSIITLLIYILILIISKSFKQEDLELFNIIKNKLKLNKKTKEL